MPRPILVATTLIVAFTLPVGTITPARATPFNWTGNGTTTAWSDPMNWDHPPTGLPTATDSTSVGDGTQSYLATIASFFTSAASLSVGANSTVSIENGASHNQVGLTLGGGITNDGTISLDGASNLAQLHFTGSQTISGTGEIVMEDSGNSDNNRINATRTDPNVAAVLTNDTGHTIRGAGRLLDNSASMINNGTIVADGMHVFDINPGPSDTFTNNGIMRATGAGGMKLTSGSGFDNTNGSIQVMDGSKLELQSATVTGGTLHTEGTGVIGNVASRSFTLDNVTLDGKLNVVNSDVATIRNGLTNDGTLNLDATGAFTADITFDGDQTIGGTGSIVMGDNANNRIRGAGGTPILTNGADHTIRGAGQLLFNTAGMHNQGTIIAEGTNALVIDPGSGAQGFFNEGTLTAAGPGGLKFQGGDFTNTGHSVNIEDGSKLELQGMTLTGGTLHTDGSGVIGNVDNRAFTFDGVAVDGTLKELNNNVATIRNNLIHSGTWSLNAGANASDILFDSGDQTIGGTGTIVMGDNANNRIRGSADTKLTQMAGHTIRGGGKLMDNTVGRGFDNYGSVIADQDTTLVIEPGAGDPYTNYGTMQATGAGGLKFVNGKFVNTGHTIEIMDGSKLELQGMILTGGTLQTSGSGYIFTGDGGNFTLDGVTVNGPVQQANFATATIRDGLTQSGTWTLDATINPTNVYFDSGTQLLDGTGTIVMGDNDLNAITGNALTRLTQAAGHTIRGAGQLLFNSTGMVNQGTIIADGTHTLVIDPGSGDLGFFNQGTVRATGTGGLEFLSGDFTNTDHTVDIGDGSKLQLQSATVFGGTLQTSGSGYVFTGHNGNFRLDGVTLNGEMDQGDGSSATIVDGLTNAGTWNLNSAGGQTTLNFINGNQSIAGAGEIVLGNESHNLIIADNATVVTVGTGQTVRGAGTVLNGAGGMVNQGTIVADQATAMNITPGFGRFVNEGMVKATGAGGIDLRGSNQFSENRGDVVIEHSRIDVTNDYVQTAGHTNLHQVDSVLATTSTVQLQGGRLSGIGTVSGNVNNTGGTLAAGNSPGTLHIDGDFAQTVDGTTEVELFGFDMGVTYDLLDITGGATLAGKLNVLLGSSLAAMLHIGDAFEIIRTVDGISSHLYDMLTVNLAGYAFSQEVRDTSLFLVTTQVGTITADAPEPTSLAVFAFGLLGLGWARWRRTA